ncbi:M48 family metallopeptidase [Streptomyces sp. NPDC002992]|uniref:M48 family metallopeptidase n=1 Tax=Streptomyces sp. NPDC002992 TaxID=3154273 RepID=UPI0033B36C74
MTETIKQAEEDREARERDCPACGQRVPVDRRFVVWCDACEWNVDPGGEQETDPDGGRVERLRRAVAQRHGERLFADLALQPTSASPPGTGVSGVVAVALAVAVHGLTVVLAALGLWLLIGRWGEGFQPAIGALLLGLAVLLRPRFGSFTKLRQDAPVLERADAPHLFALLDEVAAAVGTKGVEAVVLGPEANAGVRTYGIRRHRVLRLGLSLWSILDRQERIALLGHEFGHYAHGDTRHGLLVGSALRSLSTWRYVLAPNGGDSLMDLFANLLTALPRWTVHGVTLLLDQATLRASQRAEYLADASAARAAGTDGAAGLMDRLLVMDSAEAALQRETVAARTRIGGPRRREDREERADGLWERVAAQVASAPQREYERLRRVSELRGHSVDDTHPPTHLRRRHVARGDHHTPGIVLDASREAAVDGELRQPAQAMARQIVRDGLGA